MSSYALLTQAGGASIATPYDYARSCDYDYFRVVTIEPGTWGDAVKCRLAHRRFDQPSDRGAYKALSYAWGSPRVTETIHLDKCQVKVTLNLFCALLYLRHPAEPVIFWIDALVCQLAPSLGAHVSKRY